MPKLNVQQNNQNVIQAFKNALAIGNLKGIIASDGSHNFSTAGSNRNLLDNPWFTVNQRGFTTNAGTNNVRCVDRWLINSGGGTGGATTLNDDGTMTLTAGSSYQSFQQTIEIVPSALVGKTMTVSVLLQDGTIESKSFVVPAQTSSLQEIGRLASVKYRVFVYLSATGTNTIIPQIQVFAGNTITVRAVKLEIGSVSTLANDAPPELSIARIPCYENHLRLKGQYAPVGYAIALSTTLALLAIPTPVPMRIAPTPSLSGTLYFNADTPFAITSVQNPTLGVNQVMIQVVGTFDTGKVYLAQFRDANSYLDLSADL